MPEKIEPYNRPRVQVMRRYKSGRRGDCYEYACNEMFAWSDAGKPSPEMLIAHGVTSENAGHAWIERGGFAYDWQMIAVEKGDPIPVADFNARKEPREVRRYDARTAAETMLAAGHYGPWAEEK